MSNILQELESKIESIHSESTTKANVGIVREIGDGVAKIEGLSAAMLNEMLEFPGGIYGLALNLEETEVGTIILGDYTTISEGDEVKTTGQTLANSRRKRTSRTCCQRARTAAGWQRSN